MTDTKKIQPYPDVPNTPDLPAAEERVLAWWEKEGIFQESITQRPKEEDGGKEFVFYDGPPFANGLPHYGHLVTGYVKDVVPRYQTMRGFRVERRFGWDCHGLPAELAAEKELGISGRQAITEHGVDRFNDFCRREVLKYVGEWRETVTRQARWVDFDDDYKTMDLSYMESVIWAFKRLHDQGLIYEGVRVLPYSWAAETPVSNFETRMDDSYRDRQDPAVTILFTFEDATGGAAADKILVWTTTPWTLPSNLALAVGPDIDYGVWREGDTNYILAHALASKYEKELKDATFVKTIKGSELEGRRYRPLFPYFKDAENSFRVITAEFVAVEEGTGVVHVAPGFGEDDLVAGQAAGLPVVCPVDDQGRFTAEVIDYAGLNVFETNAPVIRRLKAEGALVRHETIVHSYPHCWRTDEPLIYRAMSSWMLQVTAIRERMVELNQQINWIPGHVKDGQFGKWIENARDWSISRARFWGAPIPVWKSDDPAFPRVDVYGSLDELERDFGVRPTDLHRPHVDDLVRPNPDDPTGKSMMRRVGEVLDCWFESGSMPYAQVHYPFENREWFEEHFPADFIVEYVAQTRGWFYTLMVLGTALFDRPPFQNVLCHGVVLDENNQKLSKRRRNYPSPEDVFSKVGADALRWFLISSPLLRGGNLSIDREGQEIFKATRQAILPLWSAVHFFTLYANAEGIRGEVRTDSQNPLDRYVLAKTRAFVEDLQVKLDAYEVADAAGLLPPWIDSLNNWYIRRSRSRLWAAEPNADQRAAYDTLYTVLTTVLKAAAPLLPLVTEDLYRALTGARSVHLEAWPDVSAFPEDRELVADVDLTRAVCSAAKSIREEQRLRTRLPLASMTVAGPAAERLRPHLEAITEEMNVREVRLTLDASELASRELYVVTPVAGRRLRGALKDVLVAVQAGEWHLLDDGTVEAGGQVLQPGEFEVRQRLHEDLTGATIREHGLLVLLDTHTTPELEREGLARDFIRAVQSLRKDLGFHVSDRIRLAHSIAHAELAEAVAAHEATIRSETLAVELVELDDAAAHEAPRVNIGGLEIALTVTRLPR